MSLAMTKKDRETFLADVHVGVLSIARDDGGTFTVPIWYDYEPGGEVVVVMGRGSKKDQLIQKTGRYSMCVQSETAPYKYVSAEGPVSSVADCDVDRDLRPIARRYLEAKLADGYVDAMIQPGGDPVIVVRMRPERWSTVDYAKMDFWKERGA